jgi:hypothetical protein
MTLLPKELNDLGLFKSGTTDITLCLLPQKIKIRAQNNFHLARI